MTIWRRTWRAAAVLALPGLGYVVAGVTGAMIPRNADWVAPAQGITIWVEDNGIHTGLVLPKVAAGVDWRSDFPAADLSDPRFAGHDHVAIGWGERGFFLGTPHWRDLRPGVLLHAAIGSDETLLHVEHVPRPLGDAHARAVRLRPAEYRTLVATIRAARASGPAVRGYGQHDAFYPGRGRYDAVRTCNDWTSDALASAGVRVGRWTPFAGGVMRWF